VFDALAIVLERLWAVAEVNGSVQFGMRFEEGRRHRKRVVKVSERCIRKCFAGVQHRLGCQSHGGALFRVRRFRPRKIVVDEFVRIPIIRLQSSTDLANPRHVHRGRKNAEMVKRRAGNKEHKVVADYVRAVEIMGRLHDTLEAGGYSGHQLERSLVHTPTAPSRLNSSPLCKGRICGILFP
jgi:hypothetical protein